jgi:hypothetical protein
VAKSDADPTRHRGGIGRGGRAAAATVGARAMVSNVTSIQDHPEQSACGSMGYLDPREAAPFARRQVAIHHPIAINASHNSAVMKMAASQAGPRKRLVMQRDQMKSSNASACRGRGFCQQHEVLATHVGVLHFACERANEGATACAC